MTDDDLARLIGDRAVDHLRDAHPRIFRAMWAGCRLSLRDTIRDDVNSLIKAIRRHDYILTGPPDDKGESGRRPRKGSGE